MKHIKVLKPLIVGLSGIIAFYLTLLVFYSNPVQTAYAEEGKNEEEITLVEEPPLEGWQGNQYFQEGKPAVDWLKIDGKWHYFDKESKEAITGWLWDSDAWYYLNQEKQMVRSDWVRDTDGHWYYLNQDGTLRSGWLKWNDNWWYLSDIHDGYWGHYVKGWKFVDGDWYFFGTDGKMVTGWIFDSGSWYFFDNGGRMLRNQYVDGWYLGDDGRWDEQPKTHNRRVAAIEAYNAGWPLAGCGEAFVSAAEYYGVDWELAAAVARVESGSGRAVNASWYYNPFGYGAYLGSSWEEMIWNWTKNISQSSIYGGTLTTTFAGYYASGGGFDSYASNWYYTVWNEIYRIDNLY